MTFWSNTCSYHQCDTGAQKGTLKSYHLSGAQKHADLRIIFRKVLAVCSLMDFWASVRRWDTIFHISILLKRFIFRISWTAAIEMTSTRAESFNAYLTSSVMDFNVAEIFSATDDFGLPGWWPSTIVKFLLVNFYTTCHNGNPKMLHVRGQMLLA